MNRNTPLVGEDVLGRGPQVPEGGAQQPPFGLHIVDLVDVLQEGDGENQPPHTGEENHQLKGHGVFHAHDQRG